MFQHVTLQKHFCILTWPTILRGTSKCTTLLQFCFHTSPKRVWHDLLHTYILNSEFLAHSLRFCHMLTPSAFGIKLLFAPRANNSYNLFVYSVNFHTNMQIFKKFLLCGNKTLTECKLTFFTYWLISVFSLCLYFLIWHHAGKITTQKFWEFRSRTSSGSVSHIFPLWNRTLDLHLTK
jgi:hypothetical protein